MNIIFLSVLTVKFNLSLRNKRFNLNHIIATSDFYRQGVNVIVLH